MKTSRNDLVGWCLVLAGLIALVLLIPRAAGPAPLRFLFGWGAFLVVPALFLGGLALAFADQRGWRVRWRAIVFGELLFLALISLLHLTAGRSQEAARAGEGGGVVGWSVAQLLTDVFGVFGAQLVTLAGVLAAVLFLWLSLPPAWTDGVWGYLAETGRRAGDRARGGLAGFHPLAWAAALARQAQAAARGLAVGVAGVFRPRRPAAPAGPTAGDPAPAAAPARPKTQRPPAASEPARSSGTSAAVAPPARRRAREAAPAARSDGLPPLDLLRLDAGNGGARAPGAGASADSRQRAQLIKQTLAEFGVPVEVVSIKEGPTVTQFGLEPGEIVRELRSGEVVRRRIPVASILRLNNDLALALAAPSLRIEAPVPGRPYVGVEVPNPAKTLVSLRNLLESRDFARVGAPLTVALGRDVSGDPVVADLARMPHLLIAGATGSGKSVCINAIICSLLMNNGPESVRLMMVDPKMVELPGYNGIPHLLGPVITDPSQAAGALAWLMLQMDDRYRRFADLGVRNIVEYNRALRSTKSARARHEPLPYLILVIDELADLMMTAAADIERQVCRLAQMSRATGIHLVLATQRPSVDVITGLIKANFPARVAFAVTSQIDSRVILDGPGAERLLGRGDMLYMAPDSPKLARIQGCFVSDQEIDRVVAFWKAHRGEDNPGVPVVAPWAGMLDAAEEKDDLLEQALSLLATKSTVSTSLLQRQLRIGFPRAARLMEQLEEMGAVGSHSTLYGCERKG